jgi:hypothetical protein
MIVQRHPLLAPLGRAVVGARPSRETHRMGLQGSNGIAATKDGRKIMGLLHVLEQHGEIRHAVVQDGLESFKPTRQQGHRQS